MRADTRRLATCALLAAVAIIMGWVERMIPFGIGIPGVKPGLANLVILLILYGIDAKAALAVNMIRIFVVGLLFAGFSGMLFSLAGGILSFLAMYLCKRTGLFSAIGVSLAGGVAHNTGQIVIAGLLVQNLKIIYYLPLLIVSGIIAGAAIGMTCNLIFPAIEPVFGGTHDRTNEHHKRT